MAVRIRLSQVGKKDQKSYRIVATERTRKRDGQFLEVLGFYNPQKSPPEIKLNRERINHWLEKGAQPSETVISLIKK